MANRFDIRVEKPGARQDWAMKPSLNSDCKPIVLDSEPAAGIEKSSHQTNNSISSFIPRWNIKEIGFIVIEQQLNDNASILTIILQTCFVIRIFINQHWRQHLDSNDPHNVGGVLSVRILGIFICQDCHRICPVNLEEDANHILMYHTCNSYILYIFITAHLHLGPVKILSTHQRPLKVSHFRTSLLQESLKLELRLLRMQEDGLDLLIISVLVMEIAEKTRDSFECNVPRYLNSI